MGTAPQDEPYQIYSTASITEAPDPPVPEEANLERLNWMQFDVDRYLGSTFAMTASLAGQGAAFNLWLCAWKQPGICLPNDERVLARRCGLKWTDQEWKDIKDEALDKFYICSNGRLYHPYISELACDAWGGYQKKVAGGKKGAEKRYREGTPAGDAIGTPKGDPIVHNITLHNPSKEPKGSLSGKKARPRPKAPAKVIIGYLNEKAGTDFSAATKSTVQTLNARWQEDPNVRRYLLIIDYVCGNWLKDETMARYVRPSTIFRESKFEGYVEDAIRWADKVKYTDEAMEENWNAVIGNHEQDR